MSDPRLYLLDVEGTVAPLSLTSEQLFPYARAHFEEFLRLNMVEEFENLELEQIKGSILADVLLLMRENRLETDRDAPRILPSWAKGEAVGSRSVDFGRILDYIDWLMDHDRKSTALKSLQGRIWKHGFESGELKGSLFADVPAAFERWSKSAQVAIYSSGSTEAQQLLFRHSIFGDLTPHIAGYFDTRVGPKQAPASYSAIAQAMRVHPSAVLFFSDSVPELDAAREAGCQTRLTSREGNAPVRDHKGHPSIHSLEQQ